MASYRAVATGNWSATSTWNTWNGSAWVAAGSVPGNADDVWSNNFTVTIDQNVTVLTLRNTTTGAPGTGTTAGGGVQVLIGGYTITCSNTIDSTLAGASGPLVTVNTSSGTTSINIVAQNTGNVAGALRIVSYIGTGGTINYTGNILSGGAATSAGSNLASINIGGSNCILNYVGSLSTLSFNQSNTVVIICTGSSYTVNLNGTFTVGSTTGANGNAIAVFGGSGTANVTGNISYSSDGTANVNAFSISSSNVTFNYTGTQKGGAVYNSQAAISSSVACVVNVVGASTGGDSTVSGSGCPAIVLTNTSSILKVSGSFIYGNYGCPPIVAPRIFLSNNTSKYIEFASDSTNGALFPSAAPTRSTMYSPNTLADSPSTNNVRYGVTYALGSQTGTLKVPDPANVALGIATDNTVGTAALTPASVWNHLLSAITTPNSIGDLLKSMIDAAISSRASQSSVNSIPTNPLLANDSRLAALDATISSRLAAVNYTAPDNTSIAAIKAKTDTILWTDVTAIKAKTDTISWADVTAIKTKTDTIAWSDITGLVTTSGQIKTKTDTIAWTDIAAIKTKTDTIAWTDVQSIKTKTDSLPATPANEATSQAIFTKLDNLNIDVPTPAEISTQVWADEPDRLKNVATVQSTGDQISALT